MNGVDDYPLLNYCQPILNRFSVNLSVLYTANLQSNVPFVFQAGTRAKCLRVSIIYVRIDRNELTMCVLAASVNPVN